MIKNKTTLVSVQKLVKMLNISDSRIRQLAKIGIIKKEKRGKYDYEKSTQDYMNYLLTIQQMKNNKTINNLKNKEKTKNINDHKNKTNTMSYVYFILDVETNKVKIGKTTDINKRIKALKTYSSSELKLLFCCPENGLINEKQFHDKYRKLRVRGEWFDYSMIIKNDIDTIKSENNPNNKYEVK